MTFAAVETTLLFAMLLLAVQASVRPGGLAAASAARATLEAGLVAGGCAVVLYALGLYEPRAMRRAKPLVGNLLLAGGLVTTIVALFHAAIRPSPDLATPVAGGLGVAAYVVALRLGYWAVACGGPFTERVLVLGSSRLARAIVAELHGRADRRSVAVLVPERRPSDAAGSAHVLGSLRDLSTILACYQPDRIVVALVERRGRLAARELIESRVHGVVVEDGVDTFERLTGKIALDALMPGSLLFAPGFRRPRLYPALARALSVPIALAGLAILSPLFVVIAAAILLESGRPVLFVHDRVGLHGRRFGLLKFRTMRPPTASTSEWAADNQHRITRVGRVLRRFRLDELPQLFNIVRGEMVLVGPRPHPVSNVRLFSEHIPYYWLRTAFPPGLTGWAQVRYGYANGLAEETEKMAYDLHYLKHMSPWLDLRIVAATAKIVLFGRHAVPRAAPPPLATVAVKPAASGPAEDAA